MTYRNKLTITISVVFVIFAFITVNLGLVSEDGYRKAIIRSRLESYADMIEKSDAASVEALLKYLPDSLRITVLGMDGSVLMDTDMPAAKMENHLQRPEIKSCLKRGSGSAIRRSATSDKKYFYFAKSYDDEVIVRVAQLFEVNLGKFFRTDWMLILSIFFLLVIALITLFYLSDRYGRKEAEKASRETRRLKHEMTGNISHELKTPVSSIQGYLETIVNHPELDEDKKQLFIERSYLQALRLSDMIKDISLITKLEEAPEQFKIGPVNIRTVFDEVAEEMAPQLEEHGIRVDNQLPPVCVRGNYHLVYSIFRNLVENTSKYAGEDCTVTASCTVEGDAYNIDYHDNGRGVDEGDLEKIFERFFRLDADRAKPVGGSGLGLSIVRNAVFFHHGSVHAYCVPGGGLGFSFTLRDLK